MHCGRSATVSPGQSKVCSRRLMGREQQAGEKCEGVFPGIGLIRCQQGHRRIVAGNAADSAAAAGSGTG